MSRRRAVATACRCQAIVLIGLDGDTCAFTATADYRPLTRTGELLAVIDGRAVYELDHGLRLHRRDRWSIKSPARRVVAGHTCGSPLPAHWVAPKPTPVTSSPTSF